MAKKKVAMRDGWSTAPVFVRVTRDGFMVFIAICGGISKFQRDFSSLNDLFLGLFSAMVAYSFVARVAVYIIFS